MIFVGLLGCSGVGLGAFGAHYLRSRLDEDKLRSWNTAVQYQLLHTVAMLAVTLAISSRSSTLTKKALQRLAIAKALWGVGILCFSGSIYGLVLGGPRALGPVTPIGGVSLMVGWLIAATAL